MEDIVSLGLLVEEPAQLKAIIVAITRQLQAEKQGKRKLQEYTDQVVEDNTTLQQEVTVLKEGQVALSEKV